MQRIVPEATAVDHDRHGGVVGLKGQHVGEEGDHAHVAGDGKDIDRSGCLFANVYSLVADVVAHCECLRGARVSLLSMRWMSRW